MPVKILRERVALRAEFAGEPAQLEKILGAEPGGRDAAAFFDLVAQIGKESIQRRRGPGKEIGGGGVVVQDGAKKFAEKRLIFLGAAEVLGADVLQVGAVGQSVLGDDIDIAAIVMLIFLGLATVRDKAVAKDHVSGAKAARVGAAEEDGILGH